MRPATTIVLALLLIALVAAAILQLFVFNGTPVVDTTLGLVMVR
jgi:hypothetical protein